LDDFSPIPVGNPMRAATEVLGRDYFVRKRFTEISYEEKTWEKVKAVTLVML
jgi:hypothetical protein